jgi:hypothetical protein
LRSLSSVSSIDENSLLNYTSLHDRTRVQIHGVLGLVGQVRAAILHLRDPRFPVVRIHPVPVRQRLLALAVKTLALGWRRPFQTNQGAPGVDGQTFWEIETAGLGERLNGN